MCVGGGAAWSRAAYIGREGMWGWGLEIGGWGVRCRARHWPTQVSFICNYPSKVFKGIGAVDDQCGHMEKHKGCTYTENKTTARRRPPASHRMVFREIKLAGSLPQLSQQPGLGQSQDGSPEFHPGLPHGWQGCKSFSHHPLLAWLHVTRKLDQRQNSQDQTRRSDAGSCLKSGKRAG